MTQDTFLFHHSSFHSASAHGEALKVSLPCAPHSFPPFLSRTPPRSYSPQGLANTACAFANLGLLSRRYAQLVIARSEPSEFSHKVRGTCHWLVVWAGITHNRSSPGLSLQSLATSHKVSHTSGWLFGQVTLWHIRVQGKQGVAHHWWYW